MADVEGCSSGVSDKLITTTEFGKVRSNDDGNLVRR